jgi:hypothetical protein
MTDGIRSSSTCRTLLAARTAQITLKRCECRCVALLLDLIIIHSVHILSILDLICHAYCLQIHANCRIRRVYFSDRLYSEDELPAEFKLYLPVQAKGQQQAS